MKDDTLAMPLDFPQYQEDLDRVKQKKKKEFENMLVIQLNRLMTYKRVEAKDLHKATGISHPTLSDWINGKVEAQMLDQSIKKIARFFGVSVDFLAYGTPMTEMDVYLDDRMEDSEAN
jgi:transcriptional regulator with XRE-family HTH domain